MTDITQEINKAIAEQNGSVRDALNVALARLLVAQLENEHLNQDLACLDFNLRQQLATVTAERNELRKELAAAERI